MLKPKKFHFLHRIHCLLHVAMSLLCLAVYVNAMAMMMDPDSMVWFDPRDCVAALLVLSQENVFCFILLEMELEIQKVCLDFSPMDWLVFYCCMTRSK